jgi:hypothetical protein
MSDLSNRIVQKPSSYCNVLCGALGRIESILADLKARVR